MNYLKINYDDIFSLAKPVSIPDPLSEYSEWTANAEEWGCYHEKNYSHSHFHIHQIETDFKNDVQLKVQHNGLPDSMHICTPLTGSVSTNFHSCGLFTQLYPKRHHHLYVPATEYELKVSRKTNVVHIEVEKIYFARLLSESDKWSATLRDKLMRQELIHSGDRQVCPAMQKIIYDLLNTPFTGYLKKIFTEAKVLELIALQLNHSSAAENKADLIIKTKDREVLSAIHEHLTLHFAEEQSLKALSKIFGLNEFKLKKGFKAVYGKTIFDYIFQLKMNHARHLLLDSGKLVCEVSREIGYKNPNHFSSAFKKQFGVNPILLRQ